MPAAKAHSWTIRSRLRAGAFGWRSDVPIKRIKEAVTEIKAAAPTWSSLTSRVVRCFRDDRNQDFVVHTIETLFAQRVHGQALGGACPGAIDPVLNGCFVARRPPYCRSFIAAFSFSLAEAEDWLASTGSQLSLSSRPSILR